MRNFVTVEARHLLAAMKVAVSVIEKRNTIPILSAARLVLYNGGLHVIGTDLDIEATIHVDVMDRSKALDICVDARALMRIAKSAGRSSLKIEDKDGRAVITLDDGPASYDVFAFPVADFPGFAWERGALLETFSNGSLAALMAKVKGCISKEETRYYLNGIAWSPGSRMMATDGHRLSICTYDASEADTPILIIPRKMVGVIGSHLAGRDVKVYQAYKNALDFIAHGVTFRAKLIDGVFPDVSRVIPKSNERILSVKKAEIATAIKQAVAIGSENVRCVRLMAESGKLVIAYDAAPFGKAVIPTSSDWPEGMDTIGFNHNYISNLIDTCGDDIRILMDTPASPTTILDGDKQMVRLLMPMRV